NNRVDEAILSHKGPKRTTRSRTVRSNRTRANSRVRWPRGSTTGLQKRLEERERALAEALHQQSATYEVMRVISNSPTDLQSALGAIADSAARLLDVADVEILRVEGNVLRYVAKHGRSRTWPTGAARPINRDWVTGRSVIDRTIVQVPD